MSKEQSAYRQIFKATSIFGGVQVFNIILSIVRAKFVAVLLGAAGMGVFGLLKSTTTLISTLSGLGLGFSAVKDISEANGTGDINRISRVITVFRRWVWFTGIIGALASLLLASQLSQWTFGNKEYTLAFVWLSVTFIINAISTGQGALLRGMRRIKDMAQASVTGSVLGLLASLPLYYYFGIKGIVPTFIITALITLLLTWYYARRIKTEKVTVSYKASYREGLGMAKLGIMMTLSGFVGVAVSYLVNIYISRTGSIADVGLYQAGWSLTDGYVGLIFTAMGTDFFPRLAAVNKDREKVNEVVNQQAEISLLIIAPLLILLISTTPLVIRILLSKDFIPIIVFVQWVVLGLLLKAATWSLGFIIAAKGDGKLFLIIEVAGGVVVLLSNILGYHYLGLEGLGISFTFGFILSFLFVWIVCVSKYQFSFSNTFIKIFSIQFVGCLIAFLIARLYGYPVAYYSGTIIFLMIGWYSAREIDKRIGILSILNKFK
ncbi:O-antigen translocase [Ferruginibacter paludis]|uniref:O-antigen translocase n=1 Tax=Ferruginibacter paludis TaxID=1310417 RepID=UPI0025B53C7A|nr:O-antigen translocase [Ferruginibacter paludis]MDN3658902.1 O-antigen translocase [Ferruginibacter paludis]